MPASLYFCHSCLPSASPQSSSTLKTFLHRCLSRKRPARGDQHPHMSVHRFRRIKGSNIVQEVNPSGKSHPACKTTNNYDMTILHDDELNSSQLATLRRRKKKIPAWAKKDQLQLAIINQVYFQEQTPEEIFGNICMDQAFDMIKSIDVSNQLPISMVVSRHC